VTLPAPVEVEAPAKVNLFLRVLAREEGGYHQLETLFQALELRDTLTLTPVSRGCAGGSLEPREGWVDGVGLEVEGAELGPLRENLVHRAARMALEAAGDRGPDPGWDLHIRLRKRVPHGAGLGGGSSDAAATLTGVNRLLGGVLSPDQLLSLAGRLGSDVPFFLCSSPLALGWGRGTRLLPLPPLPSRRLLLAVPPFSVSTPEAYRALAEFRAAGGTGRDAGDGVRLLSPDSLGSWAGIRGLAENDFHKPVFRLHPELPALLHALAEVGEGPTLLSGSGSALFTLLPGEGGEGVPDSLRTRFGSVRFLSTGTLGGLPAPSEAGARSTASPAGS